MALREGLALSCSIQPHPCLHQDLLHFRRIQIPWDPKHVPTHIEVPHTPLHPQSQSGLSSRGPNTPHKLVSKKNTPGSLWLMAAFRFLEDKPPIPLLCPPSFHHAAFLFLLGQAFSLTVHWIKEIFFLWVLPSPTWAKTLGQDYPQGLTVPSSLWATRQGPRTRVNLTHAPSPGI